MSARTDWGFIIALWQPWLRLALLHPGVLCTGPRKGDKIVGRGVCRVPPQGYDPAARAESEAISLVRAKVSRGEMRRGGAGRGRTTGRRSATPQKHAADLPFRSRAAALPPAHAPPHSTR